MSEAESASRKRILFTSIGNRLGPAARSKAPSVDKAGRSSKKALLDTPGPGTYENQLAINPAGRYPSTHVPNISTVRIRETRDPVQTNALPGPGTYFTPSDFGIYVSSRFLKELQRTAKKG